MPKSQAKWPLQKYWYLCGSIWRRGWEKYCWREMALAWRPQLQRNFSVKSDSMAGNADSMKRKHWLKIWILVMASITMTDYNAEMAENSTVSPVMCGEENGPKRITIEKPENTISLKTHIHKLYERKQIQPVSYSREELTYHWNRKWSVEMAKENEETWRGKLEEGDKRKCIWLMKAEKTTLSKIHARNG